MIDEAGEATLGRLAASAIRLGRNSIRL